MAGILINNLVMGNATDTSGARACMCTQAGWFNKGSLLEISVAVKSRVLSIKAEG